MAAKMASLLGKSGIAIKLGLFRNAKPQLGLRECPPSWGLAFRQEPISRLMHLNLMAVRKKQGG